MRRSARAAAAVLGVAVGLIGANTAWAGVKPKWTTDVPASPSDPSTGGSSNGGSLGAQAHVSYSVPSSGGKGSGPLTSADTNWSPPPCWVAPLWTPKGLKAERESIWNSPHSNDFVPDVPADQKRYIKGKKPSKHDFNMDKTGKGYWWGDVENPAMSDSPETRSCATKPFWVPKGQTPKVRNAITTKILADLAYQHTRVPGTNVHLSPATRQTVNLPTWAWLDKAVFKPVSVTARLPVLGLSATTTATPVSMKIDPGTPDARVFPKSGTCPVNSDGSIGKPFHKGVKGDPPCGVLYEHASNNGPFALKATVTWKVSWTGSDGAGDDLPDGSFGTTRDVEVQEVQTVVE